MDTTTLTQLLRQLIDGWEHELVEFKEAGKDYPTSKIGQYFSALANEANLRGANEAWLVFGVEDKTRRIVGTDYRPSTERLQALKQQIAADTSPGASFREIHDVETEGTRVLMLEVPPAPRGMPIAYNGHY